MRVLHITPHLGGGMGKAHIVVSRHLPKSIDQTFVLLEKPIDTRAVDQLKALGRKVIISEGLDHIAKLASNADIVQIEFINHPRLLECMALTDFPLMRCAIWAHISGLFKPIIQPKLMTETEFIFSSEASLALGKATVINSGFGFGPAVRQRAKRKWPVIAYLGTVNFVKMHRGFFDVIDDLNYSGPVLVWGALDKLVADAAKKMRHPERVKFFGETYRPADALAQADIFFYPLQSKHYGTGENALIEAMSMGLVPVVLDNPAEKTIVQNYRNGLMAGSIEETGYLMDKLISIPTLRVSLSKGAVEFANHERSPEKAAAKFHKLWLEMLEKPIRYYDFKAAIGATPADWFLATQHIRGITEPLEEQWYNGISKGSLAHFKKVFAEDASFNGLNL